ncbi:MAG: hypothetical protein ACREP8_03760, partial [Candidatus Binatia bacterium]
ALGNAITHWANVNGGTEWIFDSAGAGIGGLACALPYFLAVPKPVVDPTQPPGKQCSPGDAGNCDKLPIDEYKGQSFGLSIGGRF